MDKKEYIDREAAKRVMKANDWLNPAIPNVVNMILDRFPSADVAPVVHGEWIPTTKHKWKTDGNGNVEKWAWDREFHNGPLCVICGFAPCMHCCPGYDEDEDCDEHFVCSVCGHHAEEKHPYCYCGAKMDGERQEK